MKFKILGFNLRDMTVEVEPLDMPTQEPDRPTNPKEPLPHDKPDVDENPQGIEDAIKDIAGVYNSPSDALSWPITLITTGIQMSSQQGVRLAFNKPVPENWKWFSNPDVPTDNYQYTIWAVVLVNGKWYTAGIVQMWQGREWTGAMEPTGNWSEHYRANWCYDGRWGNMAQYTPKPGDTMGFFATAGNARGTDGVTSVRERSNIALVTIQIP